MNFSQKRVVWKILALYLISSSVFISVIFSILYEKQKELLIEQKSLNIKEARSFIARNLNKHKFKNFKELAENLEVNFSVTLKDRLIFSNFKPKEEIYLKKGLFLYENTIYLHTKLPKNKNLNILLKGENISSFLNTMQQKFIIFGFIAFVLMILIAYFLVKFSLRPLIENIKFLNRFIKDSTHEINAPLSVILMSIESMEKESLSPKNQTRINNINLASKALSNIYSDLTFISFNHNKNKVQALNLAQILQTRLDFFAPLFQNQILEINANLQNSYIKADLIKIQKMLDNLLSNISKFASKGSVVKIKLKENSLEFINKTDDTLPENINEIFQRYQRFNQNKGGFGVGLSIVKQICDEFCIEVDASFQNQILTLALKWQTNA